MAFFIFLITFIICLCISYILMLCIPFDTIIHMYIATSFLISVVIAIYYDYKNNNQKDR